MSQFLKPLVNFDPMIFSDKLISHNVYISEVHMRYSHHQGYASQCDLAHFDLNSAYCVLVKIFFYIDQQNFIVMLVVLLFSHIQQVLVFCANFQAFLSKMFC